ncbi:long-chain-fatty-acid--CoA ligase [Actinosynnema sp. NPDC050436]|uniref:long-chain-fatty-acid--CoA ligase n=1 Tax=Actinosynnema sp. NPDC050436 TaxID=3155659 RepID=UPI003406FBF1
MGLTAPLRRALASVPDRVATVCGDRVRTWAEHGDRVARLASALLDLGVGRGDRVAMLARNSDRYVEYLSAVPWAGAVLNPVNTRWSPEEIAYSLRDSGTAVLFVDDGFAHLVPELRREVPALTAVVHCGDGPPPADLPSYEDLVDVSRPVGDAERGGDDLAGVFYTGGTTGGAKGVMLSHRNVMTSGAGSTALGFGRPGGRFLHAAPLFHMAGFSLWLAGSLHAGTHVVLPGFDAVAVVAAVHEHRVTDALFVPTMIGMLLDRVEDSGLPLDSLRGIVYGGSPIPSAVLEHARAVLPQVGFTQAYGMTELSPVATVLGATDHDDPALRRSVGRAAPHVELRVVDDTGVEVPTGVPGEVVVRGDNVMRGYWGKPRQTAAALRRGWLHTGDVGYLDGRGYLFLVDRIKDMIISGGENVYSVEVEDVLARHPAVASCAVIGVPDPRWGERVHAVVRPVDGARVDAEELRAHCRRHIAGYKVPAGVEFVSTLPLSAAGKVLKRVLRDEYLAARAGTGRPR